MHWLVEIEKVNDHYQGSIHQGDPTRAKPLPDLELGRDAKITIKGQACTLGDLIKTLIDFDSDELEVTFDARGQADLGRYLYAQTFKKLGKDMHRQLQDAHEVEVRIITQDEHICRLPWNLLAYKGIFLSTKGWSVSISSKIKTIDCELPPSPRMLIVAPQPAGAENTKARAHLHKLEQLLSDHDFRLSRCHNLQVAKRWQDFHRLVKEFEPEIIYYYGHGQGNLYQTKLVFANGGHYQYKSIPISDFALCLRRMKVPPRLIYINCCLGDAGGILGVGMQLEDFIPAVITNRTKAYIETAQLQALDFWKSILLKGLSPHKAISSQYGRMGDLDLSLADVRWMTPVLHRHYCNWSANPPGNVSRPPRDPYWHYKIDRISQFSIVNTQTQQMLRDQKPRSLAFVWYGQEGQGIDIFHRRLKLGLQDLLANTHIHEVLPEWPAELHKVHQSFHDMLIEPFQVRDLGAIPARIRAKFHGAASKQTLIYINHQPVTSSKLINPKTLKIYLQWWDSVFVPLLEDRQFALLGISFMVKNPPKFRALMLNKEGFEALDLKETVFRLLDEMERLARGDLLEFLRNHNIRLPAKRRDRVLENILERTGGHYEKTIEELKDLLGLAWNLTEEGTLPNRPADKEYDY